MSIIFAAIGTPLASFAEGAILAASVYLVSRGVRNPLKSRRKQQKEGRDHPGPQALTRYFLQKNLTI